MDASPPGLLQGPHLEVAQWLHSVGAPLNATDSSPEGEAPLHHACSMGHLEMAQWLCSAGADTTIKTSAGSTPAQLLQHYAHTAQVDEQALRSTLDCLEPRAQVQGPLPCPGAGAHTILTHAAPWEWLVGLSQPACRFVNPSGYAI